MASGAAKAIRLQAGLSIREAAQAAGLASSTVFRWEHGDRRPRGNGAYAYLRVLDELSGRGG